MDTFIQHLTEPHAYSHPVGQIRLHETHISWVLLTGEFAYKIKKPVKLPFLDFSSLELRHHFCQEEVRLNRRLAPEIYLDVVPVTGSRESPHMAGDGTAIEYAVRMRQFAESDRLDRALASGRLATLHFARYGEALAEFHIKADRSESASFGAVQKLTRRVHENLADLEARLQPNECKQFKTLSDWQNTRMAQLGPVLQQRAADGFTRECHGDLHLRNLALLQDKIVAFDCIEFDAGLRWIDVIDDLAFLVMDLETNERLELSSVLLDAYLQSTGDYAGLGLLRFYCMYRALVRAKVAAIERSNEADGSVGSQAISRRLAYASGLVARRKPGLFLLHGLPASGKSSIAAALVEALPGIRISSDVERKRLAGLERDATSDSSIGDGIYSAEHNEATYNRLSLAAGSVLHAGRNAIVDATFLTQTDRGKFFALAAEHGLTTHVIRCVAPVDELERRIEKRRQRAADSEADKAVLAHAIQRQQPVEPGEAAVLVDVDTRGEVDIKTLVSALLRSTE